MTIKGDSSSERLDPVSELKKHIEATKTVRVSKTGITGKGGRRKTKKDIVKVLVSEKK